MYTLATEDCPSVEILSCMPVTNLNKFDFFFNLTVSVLCDPQVKASPGRMATYHNRLKRIIINLLATMHSTDAGQLW